MLTGGHPVLLGAGVDLEDVCTGAVDRLLPEGHKEEVVNLLVPQHHRLPEPRTAAAATTGVTRKLDHHLATGLHLGSSGSGLLAGGTSVRRPPTIYNVGEVHTKDAAKAGGLDPRGPK